MTKPDGRFAAFRERVRTWVRTAVGVGVALLGVALFALTIDDMAQRRNVVTPSGPSTSSTVPTTLPPRSESGFPRVPETAGRTDADLARDPAIRALFAPFTSAGEMNFVRAHAELVLTDTPAPLAYRWLRAAGKLERVEDFVAVATDPDNDRPHWPHPQSDADWHAARELLALYDRLGPLWGSPR